MSHTYDETLSIVLCGEAGLGLQTVETLLTRFLKESGFHVFAYSEIMSRIRGGNNSTLIRVSSKPLHAFVNQTDVFIPLSKGAIQHMEKRIQKKTLVFCEAANFEEELSHQSYDVIDFPISKITEQIEGNVYANIVAAGLIVGLLKLPEEDIHNFIKTFFKKAGEKVIQTDIQAINKGMEYAKQIMEEREIQFNIPAQKEVKDHILLTGTEAIGIGSIAGGCNFISSYPMTPGSGAFTFLASQSKDFGIVVEQAEDEIAAVNMAIGAWYAGARGMISTSGGGYDLMCEGVSLAGMTETPVVLHLAQRPGPATGLPTRTMQADLEIAIYAGHGEFPRIVFAPSTFEEAVQLSHKAFNLADKYQSPVFILTDHYLVDSSYNCPEIDVSLLSVEHHFIETKSDYIRYKNTDNGISPRGIPGYGDGLVIVDSDEHDEEGHITENLDQRNRITEKRLNKMDGILDETIPPDLNGEEDSSILVIGWGSTRKTIDEALERLNNKNIAHLHFTQVYPLHPDTKKYLAKAEKFIIVENNATGQFARLLKLFTGVEIDKKHQITKYNGLPFAVEDIIQGLQSII